MTQELESIKSPQDYLPADQMKEVSIALEEAVQKSKEIVVKDELTMNEANDALIRINQKQKSIEAFRLAIVKPFKDHIAKIDKFFKDLAAKFDEPKDGITKKVLDYRKKKAEAERKERERLDKKAAEAEAAGDTKKAEDLRNRETKAKAVEKTGHTESGRATYVKTAEFKVVDPNLVPKEFWIIDEKRIGKRVREITDTLEVGKVYTDKIPGVSITCTERPQLSAGLGGEL